MAVYDTHGKSPLKHYEDELIAVIEMDYPTQAYQVYHNAITAYAYSAKHDIDVWCRLALMSERYLMYVVSRNPHNVADGAIDATLRCWITEFDPSHSWR